jgi:MoxR-like ATPase
MKTLNAVLDELKNKLVGRVPEIEALYLAISARRHTIIEGPVGVGKTFLASAVAHAMGREVVRIDGDARFTEQKLTGWFDPNLVLKTGYKPDNFIEGPLTRAMKSGAILFINELNRMPEGVQNILLPALDERLIHLPQLSTISAHPDFIVIATQNPREFVATSHLSEALLDRFEWLHVTYQSEEDELHILENVYDCEFTIPTLKLVRLTRNHPKIKRGASIRAGIAILEILKAAQIPTVETFERAIKLALPTRIELLNADTDVGFEVVVAQVLAELIDAVKKNS